MMMLLGKKANNQYVPILNKGMDGYEYAVRNEQEILCSVFASSTQSIITLPGRIIKITRSKKLFREPQYLMSDHETSDPLGNFDFRMSRSASNFFAAFTAIDNAVYSLVQLSAPTFIMSVSNRQPYIFELNDYNQGKVRFSGDQKKSVIECSGINDMLVIAAGIFMIDMRFRIINDPG